MFRPELKQPKNAIGAILIVLSIALIIAAYERVFSFAVEYIAAGLYVVGMILIVIPGRAADHDQDHQEKER